MKARMYAAPVTPRLDDSWVAGLSKATERQLWILPEGTSLGAGCLASLLHAFGELRGIAWHLSPGYGLSSRIRDHKRAFGNYPGLDSNLVLRCTLEPVTTDEKLYSDVAWLPSVASDSLSSFLLGRTGHIDRAIGFIPARDDVAHAWAHIVQGLGWLALCSSWAYASAIPLLDADSVLVSYVQLTQDIGGCAGFMWRDHNNSMGLVFFGSHDTLVRAERYLTSEFTPLSEDQFWRWFDYGVYSPVL